MDNGDTPPVGRVFYRTVRNNPPTRTDFESNKVLGKEPRGDELRQPALHEGISVMDTRERGIKRARNFPMHGAFVAEVTLPVGGFMHWERTGKAPGHHTLWGSADDLMACVTNIIDIKALEVGQG